MPATFDTLDRWSADGVMLVGAVVWQSTLLALVVAAIAWALRDRAPAVRYWLWQIVALKLLVIPFWACSLPLPWPSEPASSAAGTPALTTQLPVETATAARRVAAEASESLWRSPAEAWRALRLDRWSWQAWLFLAWLAAVGAQAARLVWQRYRLARLLGDTSPAGDELVARVAGVARRLQLARPPQVRLAEFDGSPFVCRVLRPLLVLPRELLSTLAAAELEQVLLHELAHVKRRDLLWGWLSEVARMLYFFHPVAHWVAYRVRFERELACDQLALVASGRTPAQYADTLVRIVSSISRPSILRISAVAGLDGGAGFRGSPDDNSAAGSSE